MQKFTFVFLHRNQLSMYHGHIKNRLSVFNIYYRLYLLLRAVTASWYARTNEKKMKILFNSSDIHNHHHHHHPYLMVSSNTSKNNNKRVIITSKLRFGYCDDEKQSRYRKLLSANLAFFSFANYLLKPGGLFDGLFECIGRFSQMINVIF